MRDEQTPSASIAGFGFVAEARFGYFNFERGDYDSQTFRELEITGLIGTLAWKEGKPARQMQLANAFCRYLEMAATI